ncbi:hypothetical protein CLOM_g581 [Closterium sp. NIES-68]|nr:hypothetical protein CLOM_g581 [Closterium sp. NIES-68]GJP59756.1 hypothetical protein CLOP_g15125 [Closterium sp. NIES-67]
MESAPLPPPSPALLSAMLSPASLLVALGTLLLTALLSAAVNFVWLVPRRAMADLAAQGVPGPPFRLFYGILVDTFQFRKRRAEDPAFAATCTCTHVLDEMVRRYGPVVRFCAGPMPHVLVADPSVLRAIYVTHNDAFPKSDLLKNSFPLLGNGLLTASGPLWAAHRRRLNPAFKHSELSRMFPIMLQCIQAALTSWENQVRAEPGKEVPMDTMIEIMSVKVLGWVAFGARLGDVGGDGEAGGGEGGKGGKLAEGGKDGRSPAKQLLVAFRAYSDAAWSSALSPFSKIPGYRSLPTSLNQHRDRNERLICSIMMGMIAARRQRHKQQQTTAAAAAAAGAADTSAAGTAVGNAASGTEDAPRTTDLLELMLTATDEENEAAGGAAAAKARGGGGGGGGGGEVKSAPPLGTMSDQQVMDECITFLITNHETTSALLTWTVLLLSQHDTWQQRAREEARQVLGADGAGLTMEKTSELKVITMVLNEALRLYPPAPMVMRQCIARTKLSETLTIPAGCGVLVPVGAMHRRKELWGDDADEFKPERFANGISQAATHPLAFFPFTAGPHICIGQKYSMLEAKVTMSLLLLRFSWQVAPSYRHYPEHKPSLKAKYGMPVFLKPVDSADE